MELTEPVIYLSGHFQEATCHGTATQLLSSTRVRETTAAFVDSNGWVSTGSMEEHLHSVSPNGSQEKRSGHEQKWKWDLFPVIMIDVERVT